MIMKKCKQVVAGMMIAIMIICFMPVNTYAGRSWSLSGILYPNWIKEGNTFSLGGTVNSDSDITCLTAALIDSWGNAKCAKTVYPNSRSYDLKGIDAAMLFNKLEPNPYNYRVTITNASGTFNVIDDGFIIYRGEKPKLVGNIDCSKEFQLCLKEDPNYVVDLEGNYDGTNVLVRPNAGQSSSYWRIEKSDSDSYFIVNKDTGLALNVAGCGFPNGTNITANTKINDYEQKWWFIKDGDSYEIMARQNFLLLSTQNKNPEQNPNIQLWRNIDWSNQRFILKPVGGGNVEIAVEEANESKTLDINWGHIKRVGYQPKGSQTCGCYALAYCRTILDGKVHYWYEYRKNKNSSLAVPSKAGYYIRHKDSKQEVYKAVYGNINSGNPVVVYVEGKRSTGHYVTIIGYTNVKNSDDLCADNFIIIDPCYRGKNPKAENLGGVGYTLKRTKKSVYEYWSN